jgi:superfamily II DNA helicase RecQ
MTERLTCPACGAYAFAFERADDGTLELTCLDCNDPRARAVVPSLRLEERDPTPPPDPDVVEELRSWRAEEAEDRGVPLYVILHNRTIDELAREKPASADELQAVHGIGPATVERYGDDLLALLDGVDEA